MTDGADEAARFNPSALETLRRVGNGSLLIRMIDIFLSNAPERLVAVRQGIQGSDLRAVEFAAHSLKSSAAQLGGAALQRAAAAMEFATVAGDAAALSAGLDAMDAEFEQMQAWLERVKTEALREIDGFPS